MHRTSVEEIPCLPLCSVDTCFLDFCLLSNIAVHSLVMFTLIVVKLDVMIKKMVVVVLEKELDRFSWYRIFSNKPRSDKSLRSSTYKALLRLVSRIPELMANDLKVQRWF